MRNIIHHQTSLVETNIKHIHAKELESISKLFELTPDVINLVHNDLISGIDNPNFGRESVMSAEQTLKVLIVKQMNGYSYRVLQFHLEDSRSYRNFCEFGFTDKIPSVATLQRNISSIKPETLNKINKQFASMANILGLEDGKRMRFDATNVPSLIHDPSDSTLLWDSVRVLCELTQKAKKEYGITVSDHRRSAKKNSIAILNAKNKKQRLKHYRILLNITVKTIKEAKKTSYNLNRMPEEKAIKLSSQIQHTVLLAEKVVNQTKRRVINGENVSSKEKIVSIFEEHTDILKKSRRKIEFGHKITIACGASGLITDMVIEDGNPADSTLAVRMVKRQKELYGQAPVEVAFDGGYTSKKNLKLIKEEKVKNVCFHKKRGIKISDMVKSRWVFKRLRNFRAGIEGVISYLKRSFGLDKCRWKGLEHFHSYVWASIVSANALLIGRFLM